MAVSVPNWINLQNSVKKLETSTGKGHRFIPSVSQEFDCRVNINLKTDTLHKELEIRDEAFKTSYSVDYPRKIYTNEKQSGAPEYGDIRYLRTEEERLLVQPPAPLAFPLSEMKDSFRMNYHKPQTVEAIAPSVLSKCNIFKLGSEQQPAIPCHRPGYWKWTDPYLTDYKLQYVLYDQVDPKISGKILTFNNKDEFDLPSGSGNKTMYDKCTFKQVLPVRLLQSPMDRVSHSGMQSEYQNHYTKQTFSIVYPYLQDRCTELGDALPPASRWQNLAPPGMYCSEYCNIGGKPVRQTVDLDKPKRKIVRTENCSELK